MSRIVRPIRKPIARAIGLAAVAVGAVVVPLRGEVVFMNPGVYTWTVPENVFFISMVAIGAGGSGTVDSGDNDAFGGGGGGLGWLNNFPVFPGQQFTITVGTRGIPARASTPPASADGSLTSINDGFGNICVGFGGQCGGSGGGFTGDGGGQGGFGSFLSATLFATASGAGAGGYTGAGGAALAVSAGFPLTGLDGAGGGSGSGGIDNSRRPNGGGGTGLWGEGPNGLGGVGAVNSVSPAGGGSFGQNSDPFTNVDFEEPSAGWPGGGGGAGEALNANYVGADGGARIIWPGDIRLFPATETGIEGFLIT